MAQPSGHYKYPVWELTHVISAHITLVKTSQLSSTRSENLENVFSCSAAQSNCSVKSLIFK